MAITIKDERRLLNSKEYDAVRATHHPAIYGLDTKELKAAQVRLREMRDKERTLKHQKKREARGKAKPRGHGFPGTAEQPLRRKQVFAAALRRVNKEIERMRKLAARTQNVDAARRALALKRESNFVNHHPSDSTAHEGMPPLSNPRRRTKVHPSRVGRVSQRTKVAQAVRDARA